MAESTQSKSEFVSILSQKIGYSKKEAESIVNSFLETLEETFAKGMSQAFIGFGTFSVKERSERMGRNPKTGEEIKIPAARSVSFKTGTKLKAAVNQKKP